MAVKAELNSRDRRYLDMSLNAPMWKVVLYIGTPLALYQGLAAIFTILDTMMASHISKESVSAVAYLAQLNLLLSSVGGGLAVGAGIQISRAYGEGDFLLVRKRVSTLYTISLAVGLLMLTVILPLTDRFLRLAGTPDELVAVGREYFIIQLFVMVVNFLNSVYIAVERARGNARRIFLLNLAVIAVKLTLTAVFVYGLNSGLSMIAVASLCSELTMFCFAVRYSLIGGSAFSVSARAVEFSRRVSAPMIRQSLPVIAEKALFAFGKTIVNSMCTIYGALMVGAMGVSNNLGGITTNPQNGYQQGSSAIISQNFGAGRFRRVLDAFYATAAINMLLGALISGLELWQLHFLSGLFDGGSEEFRSMIALVYRYEALGAVPLGFNAAVMALLYGLGKTKLTLVLNFSRVFVFRIPVFWFLQHCTHVGQASVGIVMMVSNISVAVAAGIAAVIVIRRFKQEYSVS
ncbi:MAG: MATE family efflux transporter [Oscillospiraceae bacterium]|nr:MATE family efflux transporter [Oscillospiraceae bacterium]